MSPNKRLANNIQFLREKEGLSRIELAVKLKVNRNCPFTWETQWSDPCLDHLQRLSSYFSISIDYLVKQDVSKLHKWVIQKNYLSITKRLNAA